MIIFLHVLCFALGIIIIKLLLNYYEKITILKNIFSYRKYESNLIYITK